MKNIIVVTGGAGFVGSNLIEELIKIKKEDKTMLENLVYHKNLHAFNT